MIRLKQTYLILLALAMAVLLAATGCSKSAGDSDGKASPGATASASAPAGKSGETALKPYEVVMVYPDGQQKDTGAVQDAMNKYLKATYPELNMTVKLNPIDWSAWDDKTNLLFASNEKFDLIFTASWLNFDQQVNKGALLPLDDLLAKYGADIEAVEAGYHDAARRGGKLYAIHTHQELGGFQGVAFNKELVEKYKFDLSVLKSGEMKDLELMLQTIKDKEPGVTPAVGPHFPLDAYYKSGDMDMIQDPVGLYLLNSDKKDDFKVVSLYDTPRYKELADLTRKWYKAGYINQDATTQGIDPWAKFKAKTAFAFIGTDMEIGEHNNVGDVSLMAGKSAQLGVDILQVPLSIDGLKTGKMTATMQAISKTSGDPARTMMLLNLFYKDKQLLTLFNFGVEGTHYALKNGQIALPEGKTTDNVGFYHDIMWEIGNQMLNYTRVGEDPKKYDNYKTFNEMTAKMPSRMLGFVFDSAPVKNEIIAIDNVRKNFDLGLSSGQLDPDEQLPKLREKLKAAGIDKVIAEAQKQLDAWRAAKGK